LLEEITKMSLQDEPTASKYDPCPCSLLDTGKMTQKINKQTKNTRVFLCVKSRKKSCENHHENFMNKMERSGPSG